MTQIILILVAFVVGVVVGRVLKKTEVITEYVTAEKQPRYLVTWKRGRLSSNDSVEVSQRIMMLRADNQPYEYFMDGKQVWPKE